MGPCSRVKLYRLGATGTWEDRGTGRNSRVARTIRYVRSDRRVRRRGRQQRRPSAGSPRAGAGGLVSATQRVDTVVGGEGVVGVGLLVWLVFFFRLDWHGRR